MKSQMTTHEKLDAKKKCEENLKDFSTEMIGNVILAQLHSGNIGGIKFDISYERALDALKYATHRIEEIITISNEILSYDDERTVRN